MYGNSSKSPDPKTYINFPNKILVKMSLVPGRLTFLSLRKKICSWTKVEDLLLLLHQIIPPPDMVRDPSRFITGGMKQGEAMMFIIILSTVFCYRYSIFMVTLCGFCLFFYFSISFYITAVGSKRPRECQNEPIRWTYATIQCWKRRAEHRGGYSCIFCWLW